MGLDDPANTTFKTTLGQRTSLCSWTARRAHKLTDVFFDDVAHCIAARPKMFKTLRSRRLVGRNIAATLMVRAELSHFKTGQPFGSSTAF